MIKKHVGKKTGRGALSKSYIIYDSCNKCPLSRYIDLVCNDNLEALIVSGEPDKDILQQVKQDIIYEFSELSGNSNMQAINTALRDMYLLKAQIEGIRLASSLLQFNKDKSMEYFSSIVLVFNGNESIERILKRIKGFAKNKIRQYESAQKDYDEIAKQDNGSKITEQHFNEQIATLSKYNGFRLTKDITLAEYAAYLKDYSLFINRQEWQRMKA